MGKIVVDLHLHDFWVDHDESQSLRRVLEDQARDDGVDADALATPSGTRHKEVGHRSEIGDDGMPVDILAESNGQSGLG